MRPHARLQRPRLRAPICVAAGFVLAWNAPAAEPVLPRIEGSRVIDAATGVVTDVLPSVHVQARGVDDVAIQLLELRADSTGGRVVTSWIVRGERPSHPWLSFWIGIVEPARGTVVGFPVADFPSGIAFVDGGRAVEWTDENARHHLELSVPPLARRAGGRPPPLPTEHLVSVPHPDDAGS